MKAKSAGIARPDYGVDAPGVIRNLLLVTTLGVGAYAAARLHVWSGIIAHVDLAKSGLFAGLGCGAMALWMLYDSKIGKLGERDRLLDLIPWRGDEQVLDVGCGRGLLLIGAAKRLTSGRAAGLDLWQSEDLTGNTAEATEDNARCEGVGARVRVITGDMRKMPFPSGSFDVVMSNVAIHNIYERQGRSQAIGEIVRVLAPRGRVVIHDIRHVSEYAADFSSLGMTGVDRVGSVFLRFALSMITFGSLRPDIVVAKKPA